MLPPAASAPTLCQNGELLLIGINFHHGLSFRYTSLLIFVRCNAILLRCGMRSLRISLPSLGVSSLDLGPFNHFEWPLFLPACGLYSAAIL